MLRSMMQVFVTDSVNALEFYQKAFNAPLRCRYVDETGTIVQHSELDLFGQAFAISDVSMTTSASSPSIAKGNNMMFCLEFGEGVENEAIVRGIFEVLKEGAVNWDGDAPVLASCDYSSLQMSIVDKYGVVWCIYI